MSNKLEKVGNINSNIWRYYALSAFIMTPIHLPVLVLFWQKNGMNMFDIFILQSIFAIAVVFLEVPTGMIADRLGKRTSLVSSAAVIFIGEVIYALGYDFVVFLVAELVLAIGICLYSGADASILYDTLKKLKRENEYQKIEGRARAIQMIVFAVCNLIGGFVGSYSFRLTMWLSAIGPLIAFCVVLGLIEVNKVVITNSLKENLKAYNELLGQSFKFVKKHKLVRWNIIFIAVLSGGCSWLLWLYQPYMQFTGVPVWFFGIAFASFNLFSAFISSIAYKLSERLGRQGTIFLLMGLMIIPLIMMNLLQFPLSFLFILGHQAVRGIFRPVINDWILKYTFADKRSTVLSIASMVGRLFFAITSPLMGYVMEKGGFENALPFQAVVLLALFTILLILYKGIPVKYFQVKVSVAVKQ